MISIENNPQFRNNTYSASLTYFGLSTDTKPTGDAVGNGSCFLEMNTGKIYFYDATGAQWREWGA